MNTHLGTPHVVAGLSLREEAFAVMCREHDLTYLFADDHKVWAAGRKSLYELTLAAAELPREVAVRIWNEEVDRKITDPEIRKQFYWSPI